VKFDLSMEDYTIILNALHYYKKVEKRGNFKQYDADRCNELRDKLADQLVHQDFGLSDEDLDNKYNYDTSGK